MMSLETEKSSLYLRTSTKDMVTEEHRTLCIFSTLFFIQISKCLKSPQGFCLQMETPGKR